MDFHVDYRVSVSLVGTRAVRRELLTNVHPNAVVPIRVPDEILDEETIRGLLAFTAVSGPVRRLHRVDLQAGQAECLGA